MEFNNFVKYIEDKVFNFSAINFVEVALLFERYKASVEETEREIKNLNKLFSDAYDDLKQSEEYKEIDHIFMDEMVKEEFGDKTITKDRYCLKDNLVKRACQIRNTDQYGVIIELVDNKYLLVDFGDIEPIKVDIDELIITGQ